MKNAKQLTDIIGFLPYRMAFAGGWIDQPFVSQNNPAPPGSMVVVALEPTCRFMERSGMGTSTRKIAAALWGDKLPDEDPEKLMRELYAAENARQAEPSGSQDMAGIVYPGINRLDYDFAHEGGYFPVHIESNNDPGVARWLERVLHMVPIAQRPPGYNPLGEKNLDPAWIKRLGQSGKECFDAIVSQDVRRLGASMNECMKCWEAILPCTVRHPTITIDLMALLDYYQSRYAGAMYSGSGGGYIYVVAEEEVPGSFHVNVRIAR
ncbi:MAG TPA: hypothetical protein PKZ84_17120 [Anaerolineae bacterium]|nr:hypothetical protein [Anaerolineae bacterium]HQI86325.1 hypothetical protein [Anaerolineae bacterium]